MVFRNPLANFGKKAKTKVNACMVKTIVKRSRRKKEHRFLFCLGFFSWRKPNLNPVILLGKVVRRNCSTHSPDWHLTKTSWEITSISSTGGEEPALCSPPKPGNAVLLQGATSSAGALHNQGRRTPSAPHCSSSTFGLHTLLSQALLQAHLLLLINKSSLHIRTLIVTRLRLGTAGLSLWVCLFIQHLFFLLSEQLSLCTLNTSPDYPPPHKQQALNRDTPYSSVQGQDSPPGHTNKRLSRGSSYYWNMPDLSRSSLQVTAFPLLMHSLQLLLLLHIFSTTASPLCCTENSTVLHFSFPCWHTVFPVRSGPPFWVPRVDGHFHLFLKLPIVVT